MKRNASPALKAAIEAVERMSAGAEERPDLDPRWIALTQLHQMNLETLKLAEIAESYAGLSILAAKRAANETKMRLEILMIDLGLQTEDEDEEAEKDPSAGWSVG